jgi:tetratricopeptide (TPR) repeat protein
MRCPVLTPIALATMLFCSALSAAEPAQAVIKRAHALLAEGKRQEGRGLLEKSIDEQRQDVEARPNDADPAFQLAQLYMELSRDDEAVAAIDQAIKRDDKQAKYHYLKGVLALYAEKNEAAIPSLRRAVELEPKNPDYRDRLARIYMATHDDAKAEPEFEALVKLDPKNIGGLVRLAIINRRRENYDAAIRFIEQARAIDPQNVEALQMAGIIYEMGDRPAEHLAAVKRLAEINPESEYALGRLLVADANAGRKEEAAAYRKRLIELHGKGKTTSPSFDRETFTVGKSLVVAREHYQLEGPRAVRYAFDVKPPEGPGYRISLGSYDITTEIARQTGSIKADERMFHLDWYGPEDEHRTYGMFAKEPTYEATRVMVREIVDGKRDILGASKPGKQGIEVRVKP